MVLLGILYALLIAGLLVGGSWAWWLASDLPPELAGSGLAAPAGPDDDPEFLRALERRIRGEEPGSLN